MNRIAFAGLLLAAPAAAAPTAGIAAASGSLRVERAGIPQSGPRIGFARHPAVALVVAEPTFKAADADVPVPDAQDIVFFGEKQVVRVRLRLKGPGEPVAKRWRAKMKAFYDFFDRDGDGALNAFEAEFLMSNRTLQAILQTGYGTPNPADVGRSLGNFDRDGDGRVSFDEFLAYYAPTAATLVRAKPSASYDFYGPAVTDELFKLLDTNGDGKIAKDELAAAERLIRSRDLDEDECLTVLELVPDLYTHRAAFGAGGMMARPTPKAASTVADLYVLAPDEASDALVKQIMDRYDANKNLELSKSESPFAPAVFAALDKNGNGVLSVTEVAAWKAGPVDVEIELLLADQQPDCVARVLPRPGGKPWPRQDAVTPAGDGRVRIDLGRQAVAVGCSVPTGAYTPPAVDFAQQFPDLKGKGYLLESDLVGPQFQYYRVLFDLCDRNGDGKFTREEYARWAQLTYGFTGLQLAAVHSADTPGLFALLDANGDGRLSVKELRTAWDRLSPLADGGPITKAVLRPQGSVRFGKLNLVQYDTGRFNAGYAPTVGEATKGPTWFRKLDRNADGDLSRAEFPGTDEQFAKLDADGDGYISLAEADAADKALRPKK